MLAYDTSTRKRNSFGVMFVGTGPLTAELLTTIIFGMARDGMNSACAVGKVGLYEAAGKNE